MMTFRHTALALLVSLSSLSAMAAEPVATVDKPAAPSVPQSAVITPAPAEETAQPGVTAPAFTPEQEARIGQVAADYLVAHPEILVQVSQKLQAQQQARQMKTMTEAVLRHQDALLDDNATPSYGPADAKVAFIEFSDYVRREVA